MVTNPDGFSAEERAAMKERAAEAQAAKRRGTGAKKAQADLADALAKIDELSGVDRDVAETLHRIVTEEAPNLAAKTWYGMPAYARDGKVVLFCKPAAKFKARYAEVGFNEDASLDSGDSWPTAYAVVAMTPKVEATLRRLVKKAARPPAP